MMGAVRTMLRFNPTLVRLRQANPDVPASTHPRFQSHAGSIEANIGACLEGTRMSVSIPRWFD